MSSGDSGDRFPTESTVPPTTSAEEATTTTTTAAAADLLGTGTEQTGEEALGTPEEKEKEKVKQRQVSFAETGAKVEGEDVEQREDVEVEGFEDVEDVEVIDTTPSSAHQLLVGDDVDEGAQNAPIVAGFKDHFSLPVPTSRIRYRAERSAAARIVQVDDAQIILEETPDEVSIRKIHDTSEGVRALRILYAIVVAFWTGFLLVVCLQILLYLVFDVAVEVGATSKQTAQWGAALGVIFAIIPFVYGLASALVIAGAFILDTWQGHLLIRNFALRQMKSVAVEWFFFLFFLGLPLLLMGITLLARLDEWWVITGLFWITCIGVFYIIFMFNVGYYEMHACWMVCRNQYRDIDRNSNFWQVVSRSILLRQRSSYSGIKTVSYLSYGSVAESEETDKNGESNMVEETRKEYASLRSKFTSWLASSSQRGKTWYAELEEPQRIYSIDDARDYRPYITSHSWSLEKAFCRPRHSRYVAIVDGPGALTRAQMKSSVACSFIGSFLIFFLVLAGLVYMQLGAIFVGFIIAVGIIIALPNFFSTYQLYKAGKDFIFVWNRRKKKDEDNVANAVSIRSDSTFYNHASELFVKTESNAVYLVSKSYRVTRASDKLCWTMFVVEIAFLFLWPLISLFAIGNWQLGLIFFFVAAITACRYYINAAVVLEEAGHMDLCDGATERDKWKNQSRLNEIIGNITRGRSRGAWMAVLGVVGFCFLALGAGAIGTSEAARQGSDDTQLIYLNDFEYTQLDSLRYPSCQLTIDLGASPITTMADFAYLAALAYREVNITQSELDGWFGTGVALDRDDFVQLFKNVTNSQVSFKMITFPGSGGNFSIVSIRGTTNAWDALTDAQLWSAAALMQVLRFVLPIGSIWTPLMDRLIQAISSLDSQAIEKVAFYKDTTAFVNAVMADIPDRFRGVAVTGHSLGGGLSLITGAQTGVPAVALSGPNAMLSRKSFEPPVKEEALNSKTFNIIPNRDVVPMIDDRAQNFQEIRCTTATPDIIGCHNAIRSLCEIIYTCGTGNRPAICACVTKFGYPEPQPINGTNRNFTEACGSLE